MNVQDRIRLMSGTYWALLPSVLESVVAGDVPSHIAAAPRSSTRTGAIVVVPIQGVMTQKGGSSLDDLFGHGGTSSESLGAIMRKLAADDGVGTIVLDVNSPGGQVNGVEEAADAVFQARSSKRIVAVANTMMASAAYWVASQAHEIIASPSSMVGSIGVMAVHEDVSVMAENLGIKMTVLSAGKHKADGHKFAPLSDEARAHEQKLIDGYYSQFVSAVARGRRVSQQTVRDGMGQGRVFSAKDAVSMGMADKVGTFRDSMIASGGMMAFEDLEIVASADGGVVAEFDPEVQHQIERERWEYAKIG